jgi:hypothetical protein
MKTNTRIGLELDNGERLITIHGAEAERFLTNYYSGQAPTPVTPVIHKEEPMPLPTMNFTKKEENPSHTSSSSGEPPLALPTMNFQKGK